MKTYYTIIRRVYSDLNEEDLEVIKVRRSKDDPQYWLDAAFGNLFRYKRDAVIKCKEIERMMK